MQVTEARIYLKSSRAVDGVDPNDSFLAYATIVIDDALCIDGLKVLKGKDGRLFLGMPTKRVTYPCGRCRTSNGLADHFCRHCSSKLDRDAVLAAHAGPEGKVALHKSVAHPVHSACREMIEDAVLEMYYDAEEAAKKASARAPLADRVALAGRA